MNTSEKIDLVSAALSKFQGEVKPINRSKTVKVTSKRTGGTYEFKYAPLENIVNDTRPLLTKHELGIIQSVEADGVLTRVVHSSGQFLEVRVPLARPEDASAQAMGSAITYARRYGYCAAIGIVSDDDDDGNGADGNDVETLPSESYPKPTKNVNTPNSDYGDYNQYLNEKDRDFTPKKTANVTRGVGNLKKPEPIMNPAEADETADSLISQINEVKNEGLLRKWQSDKKNVVESLPQKLKEKVMGEYGQRLNEFRSEAA